MIETAEMTAFPKAWEAFLSLPDLKRPPMQVPLHLAAHMPGAELILWEWETYRLHFPGAIGLWINHRWLPATFPDGFFELRFENQLGATVLQPDYGTGRGDPIQIEVLASKFGTAQASLDFTQTIVQEIAARIRTLPFVVKEATARQIERLHREPSLFFAFHYIRHHSRSLIRALQVFHADPHRRLGDIVEDVRIHQTRAIDAEAVHSLLTGPRAGTPRADGSTPLTRLQPLGIRQRRPEETWNTAENQFILAVCQRLRRILTDVRSTWWFQQDALESDHAVLATIDQHARQVLMNDHFRDVSPRLRIPAYSRVLQHRPGYREATMFWHGLMQIHRPVLAKLSQAVDQRDVATLYEYWLFFELSSAIEHRCDVPARYPAVMDPYQSRTGLTARFEGVGRLDTQRTFSHQDVYSYAVLRPDFVWTAEDGRMVILDAKFRMNAVNDFTVTETDDLMASTAYAKQDDLVKMHAYRDAIRNVESALVLFPGTEGRLWPPDGAGTQIYGLEDILDQIIREDIAGVGAIPVKPGMGGFA